MIVYGLLTSPIVLGAKQDLCATCDVAGPHVILRRVRWVEIFFIPVLPLWINHRLVCANCGAETKLGFFQVRQALSSGKLPLPHRARFDEYADALWNDNQRRPSEVEFDTVEKSPKRSGWSLYLMAYPVLLVALIAAAAFWPREKPQPLPTTAHQCWLASDGSVAGCRMFDGTLMGEVSGDPTTCYFVEPLPTGDASFTCTN
jgi:hypothetical protein